MGNPQLTKEEQEKLEQDIKDAFLDREEYDKKKKSWYDDVVNKIRGD